MNELLYGHNPDPHIVAVQQAGDNKIRIYKREESAVSSIEANFFPFFFLSDASYLRGFSKKHWISELSGDNFFRYVCAFSRLPDMWEAVKHVMAKYNETASSPVNSYSQLPVLYVRPDPTIQYLLQSGKTLFKEMNYNDLRRLQLQIIIAQQSSKPATKNISEREILFAVLSDNTGFEKVLRGRKKTEKEILLDIIAIIQEKDPDIIEGHDIKRRELPFLYSRCQQLGIECNIGRERTPLLEREIGKIEARYVSQIEFEIPGRHIIDTKQLAQSFDFFRRSFDEYNLHVLAEYFGFASSEYQMIPTEKVLWFWNNDPDTLQKHFLINARYIQQLAETISQSAFYLSQIVPMNFGVLAVSSASSKLELLLVREYLRKRFSLPSPQQAKETGGGYTDIFYTGILEPILHFDVDSLYPSLMILHHLKPKTDRLNIFIELLSELTSMRLEAKQKMKKAQTPHEKSYYDALQSSFKILINSFYGYLGYRQALFNDYDAANEVTSRGQQLLRHIMEKISLKGGKVVEVDTDGVYFVPPRTVQHEEDERNFCSEVSSTLPKGITLSIGGRFKKMLSYKKKNYALLDYDEKIIVRGSSLTSRSMERFCRNFLHHVLDAMLHENFFLIHELYRNLVHDIINHKLSVEDFAKVETLNEPLERYLREAESGKRNRSAVYEAALTSGLTHRVGDKIAYYIAGNDANVKAFEHAKLISNWDPNFPDENVGYYLKRLEEVISKFKIFFSPDDFKKIFSTEEADKTFFTDIAVITKAVEVSIEPNETESTETAEFEPKIWLDL